MPPPVLLDRSDDTASPTLPLPFPLFVKPVSAHLSQMAFEVHDRSELERGRHGVAREQLDRSRRSMRSSKVVRST